MSSIGRLDDLEQGSSAIIALQTIDSPLVKLPGMKTGLMEFILKHRRFFLRSSSFFSKNFANPQRSLIEFVISSKHLGIFDLTITSNFCFSLYSKFAATKVVVLFFGRLSLAQVLLGKRLKKRPVSPELINGDLQSRVLYLATCFLTILLLHLH